MSELHYRHSSLSSLLLSILSLKIELLEIPFRVSTLSCYGLESELARYDWRFLLECLDLYVVLTAVALDDVFEKICFFGDFLIGPWYSESIYLSIVVQKLFYIKVLLFLENRNVAEIRYSSRVQSELLVFKERGKLAYLL